MLLVAGEAMGLGCWVLSRASRVVYERHQLATQSHCSVTGPILDDDDTYLLYFLWVVLMLLYIIIIEDIVIKNYRLWFGAAWARIRDLLAMTNALATTTQQ